jgi:hypothetical protein
MELAEDIDWYFLPLANPGRLIIKFNYLKENP